MKVALVALCVSAVVFLVRVLAAFVSDARSSSPLRASFYFARFVPPPRRAKLVVLNPEHLRSEFAGESGEQIAS